VANPSALLIDMGNSCVKFGAPVSPDKIATILTLSRGESLDTDALLTSLGKFSPISRVLISCVGPEDAFYKLKTRIMQLFRVPFHRVYSTEADCGVINCSGEPGPVGADGWCALIGARRRCKGDVCVVDVGSAVTVDFVSGDGRFRGGIILPGWNAWRETLLKNTSLFSTPDIETNKPGCSTQAAITAGYVNAVIGSIDQVVQQLSK